MMAWLAASDATSPWWGIPAFTLAGGVVGAGITQLFASLNARRKEAHDATLARAVVSRTACAEFLAALNRHFLAEMTGEDSVHTAFALYSAWNHVQFTSAPEIVASARQARVTLLKVREGVQGNRDYVGGNELNSMVFARAEFINAVRREFGLEALAPGLDGDF